MAVVELNDVLASGDVKNIVTADNIVVGGNIGYSQIQDPAYDDMFMRVTNGVTTLYRAPDQDVHWKDANLNNLALTTSPSELLSVTPNLELTVDDSGYKITGRLDNTQNQTRQVTLRILYDTVQVSTAIIAMDKLQTNVPISYTGLITDPVSAGTVIAVTFEANASGVQLRGDIVATGLQVTKAQSAPVSMTIEQVGAFDWNQLPFSNPHIAGQLYIGGGDRIKVSQG